MALIRRVSRLFTADVHAVLDQIEEPEIVLKQAIREMEEELARQTQRGKWLQKEIEAARNRFEAVLKTQTDVDSKLDLCFANDNETLARKLTRRKLEAQRLAEELETKQGALQAELDEHEALVAGNRDQLEGMRQKASLLCAETIVSSESSHEQSFSHIDDDEVEIAFLKEKQAREQS